MKRFPWSRFLFTVLLCISCPSVGRSASQAFKEKFDEAQRLVSQGRLNEATSLLLQLKQQHPEDVDIAINLGHLYNNLEKWSESIRYHEEALRLLRRTTDNPMAVAFVHRSLALAYEGLGRQRYFSPELSLRILYHLEQAWPHFTELGFSSVEIAEEMELARFALSRYEMADRGVRVMEMETAAQKGVEAVLADDLQLPPDGVSQAAKLGAKDAMAARVQGSSSQR